MTAASGQELFRSPLKNQIGFASRPGRLRLRAKRACENTIAHRLQEASCPNIGVFGRHHYILAMHRRCPFCDAATGAQASDAEDAHRRTVADGTKEVVVITSGPR